MLTRSTLSLDQRIAREHVLIARCTLAGHDDEREFYAVELAELESVRATFERMRATRQNLSERYARELWSGNTDAARLLDRQITRLEAGQQP